MGSPMASTPQVNLPAITPLNAGNPSPQAVATNPLAAENAYISAQTSSISDAYQSAASELSAAGNTAEADIYGQASSIAGQNALLALDAGQIKEAQTQLAVNRAIGSQRAAVASNGFAEAGSAVDVMRASLQQGSLDEQLDVENASLQAGAFEEQKQASAAEQTAASTAASMAKTTADMAKTLSTTNATIANNMATAINQSVGQPGVPSYIAWINARTANLNPNASKSAAQPADTSSYIAPIPGQYASGPVL